MGVALSSGQEALQATGTPGQGSTMLEEQDRGQEREQEQEQGLSSLQWLERKKTQQNYLIVLDFHCMAFSALLDSYCDYKVYYKACMISREMT